MLRSYQHDAIHAINNSLVSKSKALIVLPTGSGKTKIFSSYIQRFKNKANFLLVVNKTKLVEQAYQSFSDHDIKASIFSASLNKKDISEITIASIQSLRNYKEKLSFDCIIFDEVHAFDLKKESWLTENKKVIGFTATPFTNKKLIYGDGEFFDIVDYRLKIDDLTPKYLVPLYYQNQKSDTKVDLKNVAIYNGDYSERQLNKTILKNKDKIDEQVKDALSKSVGYKKIIVLTVSIAHAEYVYNLLDDSTIVHSKLKKDIRNKNFNKFQKGNTRILVSVLIASEGVDIPEADCLWFMRPTRSMRLYVQGAGRILRMAKNKDHALMLDYGGIVENLGFINKSHEYNPKKSKSENVKLCPSCDYINKIDARKCTGCQEKFVVICPRCLDKKFYGETCPNGCKETRDTIKNTTLRSYSDNYSKTCTHIKIITNKGPKGYYDLIRYYEHKDSLKCFCKEYLSHSQKWAIERHYRNTNYDDSNNFLSTTIYRNKNKFGWIRSYVN